MGLRLKFNIVMISCLMLGFIAIYWIQRNNSLFQATLNLNQQAEQAFQISESIRNYNNNEVANLIVADSGEFKPQSVASYAASMVFSDVSESMPFISYKVAINNSKLNLYQPNVWQQNIINTFINNPKVPLITDKVFDARGGFFIYAKPTVKGTDVSGAKIIRIDEAHVLNSIEKDLNNFILILIGIFVVILLVFNLMLQSLVIKPIRLVSTQAEKISQGQSENDELPVTGSDEINQIAMAFNRMQRSLKAAMSMLS